MEHGAVFNQFRTGIPLTFYAYKLLPAYEAEEDYI
jgi:hypothetical protein